MAIASDSSNKRRPFIISRQIKLLAGSSIVGLLVAVALLSLVWTPLPPAKMQIIYKLQPPFAFGVLGTDQFGRDVLSMLMAGCWNSLSIAITAVAIGGTIGSAAGISAAATRGIFETLLMRVCDVIFALPPILSAMILGAFLGSGRFTAITAIAVFMIPVFARVTLAAALQAWSRDYVLAARAIGNSRLTISVRHVLPNIMNQIIVHAAIQLGLAILTEAGLKFPWPRRGAAGADLGPDARRFPNLLLGWRHGLPSCQGLRSDLPFSASTCWAMDCAISSTRGDFDQTGRR